MKQSWEKRNFFFWKFRKKFRNFLPFLPKILKIRIFPVNLILPFFTPCIPLTSCKKSEKSNEAILRKTTKTLFAPRPKIRIFPKNLIRPLFTPYIPLTSCKKSEKSNEAILRKTKNFFSKISKKIWKFFSLLPKILKMKIFPVNLI